MTEMLVGVAVACVVAAAVGGGVETPVIKIPSLLSTRRQVLVALVGIAIGVLGFVLPEGGGDDSVATDAPPTTPATSTGSSIGIDPSVLKNLKPPDFDVDTTITLSRSSGPPGTVFTVSGSGFNADERVEIRFHTRVLGEVRADGRGDFTGFQTEVPDMPFRDQFDVVATGQSSIRSARKPFEVR
jgi:hypothetical protein